tara:strand:- start:11 stop:1378 length:1368 start_codon:yes stop_codon:yes gene_type:complete
MKNIFLRLLLFLISATLFAKKTDKVSGLKNEREMKLIVYGMPFMVNGMNLDCIPVGTNTVNANFWKKPDDIIQAALDTEMSFFKNMGVNSIGQYTGVPAKWIRYIHENYDIYTVLNHSFGRYGFTLDGVWLTVGKYGEERTQKFLLKEIENLAKEYKDTPGILLYLLGNENNYGLFWVGAETEDFLDENQKMQVCYLVENWKEIYQNAAGLGKVQNANGGFTFKFLDWWWKVGFDDRIVADSHQTESTLNAGRYLIDQGFPGANNMNKEGFSLCVKGQTNARSFYTLYPRAANYALKQVHSLYPFGEDIDATCAYFIVDSVSPSLGSFARKLLSGFESVNPSAIDADVKQANVFGAVTLNTEYEISFDASESPLTGGVFFVEFFPELSGGGVSKAEIVTGGPHPLTPGWTTFAYKVTSGNGVSGGITLQMKSSWGSVGGCLVDVNIDNVSIQLAN